MPATKSAPAQPPTPAHTDTPWNIENRQDPDQLLIVAPDDDDDPWIVAEMMGGLPDNQMTANAALIVQAVNSHAALVKALQSISVFMIEEDDRLWLSVNGVEFECLEPGAPALLQFDANQRAALAAAEPESHAISPLGVGS